MLNSPAEPMLPTPYRVLKVSRETGDTFTLTLAPPQGAPGFPFAPGQFNMLYIFGVGEVPISISGDPDRPETLVHTVRAVGAVSRAICGLKKGDTLGGPFVQGLRICLEHCRKFSLMYGQFQTHSSLWK